LATELSVERITVKRGDLEDVVLQRLVGTVFHVTSAPAFVAITASGVVRSNQDGRLGFTWPQSQKNYGRRRGYVCLFDLRDVPEDKLWDALHVKLNFLKPTKDDPVFLFLDPSAYGRLIPWTVAKGNYAEVVIPYVESWYPSDLPVSALAKALAVTVEADDANSAFRRTMRDLRRDVAEILDTGRVDISARTVEELRHRAAEWIRTAQDGGLEVDEEWDERRVEPSGSGWRISLHATGDGGLPDPERCPKCGTELRAHGLQSSFDIRGRPFVPSTFYCMGCGYERPFLDPVETADGIVLDQLTPDEWDAAYGELIDIWRRGFAGEEGFLAAYHRVYGEDERALAAWRRFRG
jgi:hypothetical protein